MKMTRREFLAISAAAAGSLVISTGLSGCGSDSDDTVSSASSSDSSESSVSSASSSATQTVAATFEHGVASGDPMTDKVIIWTRATPVETGTVEVTYEVATDEAFTDIIHNGTATTSAATDYTVKIDVQNLSAGMTYFYRFSNEGTVSPIGKMKTLPGDDVTQVKMAVFSCANYPKGYFNAYTEAATLDLDVVLHLGDYIYEYGMLDENGDPAYATENAEAIGRVLPSDNDTELLSLDDYRKRYALYHTDSGLQALHAAVPFITVWDDHEVANDTYKEGAENHSESEGDFETRKAAALQAYFEWLPIRPASEGDNETIYRAFTFGSLLSLYMLDTRIIARDKQLDYTNYITAEGALDTAAFTTDFFSTTRKMIGDTQMAWLQAQMSTSTATWQVLGQQVLMGRMNIPAELLTGLAAIQDDSLDSATQQQAMIQLFAQFEELATIKTRMLMGDETLTEEEIARVTTVIPYNLDAWDGYFVERETILQMAGTLDKNLVVLSGDTHNSWASDLKTFDVLTQTTVDQVGVEFATTSVSSPGMEEYIGITSTETAIQTEQVISLLIDDLQYCNLNNRGLMVVTFTEAAATAEWIHIDNINDETYSILSDRTHTLQVLPGAGNRKLVAVDA